MIKQSNFSRSLVNDSKLGAYYTDTDHCRRIGNLFSFPENFCVLEPSIGDGSAVQAVLGTSGGSLFGVEVNEKTVQDLTERNVCEFLLQADFLKGVKISNKAFSFCFSNPPYGDDPDAKKRLEQEFLEKTFGYLAAGAVYALVIPYYVLKDERFSKCYAARFSPLAVYRFDDKVYQRFKQIVVIGKRRESLGYLRSEYERWYSTIDTVEKLAYLPQDQDAAEKIPVPESFPENVEYFTTLKFDVAAAGQQLSNSPVYDLIGKFRLNPYMATEIGHPPVPLKKDLLYLCAVSGGGQGLVGSEEDGDLHLQRGEAKIVKDQRAEVGQNGKSSLVETSRTKIVLNIIENDGTITSLE